MHHIHIGFATIFFTLIFIAAIFISLLVFFSSRRKENDIHTEIMNNKFTGPVSYSNRPYAPTMTQSPVPPTYQNYPQYGNPPPGYYYNSSGSLLPVLEGAAAGFLLAEALDGDFSHHHHENSSGWDNGTNEDTGVSWDDNSSGSSSDSSGIDIDF